jgi:hypothetical protein
MGASGSIAAVGQRAAMGAVGEIGQVDGGRSPVRRGGGLAVAG